MMIRSNQLFLAATLPCLAALTAAASSPKESKTPISAKNAHQVQSVLEVPKRADRLLRGSRRGELVIQSSVWSKPDVWTDTAEIVDDTNFRTIRKLAKDQGPTDIVVSPDGKLAAWTRREGTNYTVQDLDTGKSFDIEIGRTPGSAAFSPNGKLLAIGYLYSKPRSEGEGYSEIRLFDIKGKLVRTLAKNGYGAPRPVFSPDGKTLAVGNRNRRTQVFDVATGKLLHTLNKKMTHEVAFSPDGKTLAAGYVDGTVALWDVAAGKLLHSAPSGCDEVYSVDWNPKGDVLASSGRNGRITLWEPNKFTKLKAWYAPFWVIQIRFTADGTRLLSSSAANWTATKDRKIEVWAVPRGSDR